MAGSKYEQLADFHISQEDLYEEIEIFAPMSKKQEIYINDNEHDWICWGGGAASGKSTISLLKLMIDCLEQPNYNSLLLRESVVQIKSPGSLWEEGCRMYGQNGIDAKSNAMTNQWRFPNGSFVKAHYLKNNQNDLQGSQVHSALIDEAAQIKSIDDIQYVTSRLRGKGDKKKQLRCTFNPDRNSPLCQLIIKAGYIGDDGFVKEGMDGKTKFLIQLQGDYHFFDTRQEIEELYGKAAAKSAFSFVFYKASVHDNPVIIKHQPEYLFKLENLKRIEKDRLLHGNFFAMEGAAGHFKREDVKEIEASEVPLGLPTVRSIDLAATKPDPEKGGRYADPDWSRLTKCSYDKNTDTFYILDMKSMRDRSAVVDNLIMKTARTEPEAYYLLPQDAGAAGVEVAQAKRTRLLAQGNKPIIVKARQSKLKSAENFLIACQEGRVCIVKGVFSDAHYTELENFIGDGKNNGHHDDIIDTLAQAYTALTSGRLIPTIKVSRDNKRLNNLFGKTLL